MKARMIVAAMALFVTIGLSAQTPQKTSPENRKSCYVDKNNNGVCDKHEDGTCKTGNGKGLQDGSCNKDGKGKSCGLHNGNSRKKRQGKGNACGSRDGSGKANGGKGKNFVDANNNGVCDHKENADKK